MRWYPAVVSIALIGATMSPVLRAPSDDGFPLSTYPMFAVARPLSLTITYAITAPVRHVIAPSLVGTGEPLQAMAIFETAAKLPEATQALCERIAGRVARDGALTDATSVRIVTGTHDAIEYLVRGVVGPELERASCTVYR